MRKRTPKTLPGLVVLILGVATLGGCGGGGKGVAESPARLMIVGPTTYDLASAYSGLGFEVEALTFNEAETEGKQLDASLKGQAAIERYADERGFGYVSYLGIEHEKLDAETRGVKNDGPCEVITRAMGDLAKDAPTTCGRGARGVSYEPRAMYLQAVADSLLKQPYLRAVLDNETIHDSETNVHLEGADAKFGLEQRRKARDAFEEIAARPMNAVGVTVPEGVERVEVEAEDALIYPLANGHILVAAQPYTWKANEDAERVLLERGDWTLGVLSGRDRLARADRGPCEELPAEIRAKPVVSTRGDVLAVATTSHNVAVGKVLVLDDGSSCSLSPKNRAVPMAYLQFGLGDPNPRGSMINGDRRLHWTHGGRLLHWNRLPLGPVATDTPRWIRDNVVAYGTSFGDDERDRLPGLGLAAIPYDDALLLEGVIALEDVVDGTDEAPAWVVAVHPAGPADERILLAIEHGSEGLLVEVDIRGGAAAALRKQGKSKTPQSSAKALEPIVTRRVLARTGPPDELSASADGKVIAFTAKDPGDVKGKTDVWLLNLREDSKAVPRRLAETSANEINPRVASDGSFVTFTSQVSTEAGPDNEGNERYNGTPKQLFYASFVAPVE